MTSGAPLPANDDGEEFETPIARVLRAAMLAEDAQTSSPSAAWEGDADEPAQPDAAQAALEQEEQAEETAEVEATEEPPEPEEPAGKEAEPEAVLDEVDFPQTEENVPSEEPEQPEETVTSVAVATEAVATVDSEAMAAWTEALHSVERSVNEAAEAIRFLRATLQQMAPLLRSLGGLEEALHSFGDEQPPRRAEPRILDDARTAPPPQYDDEEVAEPDPLSLSSRNDAAPVERDWAVQRRKPAASPKENAPKSEEAESQWTPPAGPSRPVPKPVTLVPDDTPAAYAYRLTIEDRSNSVELLPLHRALSSISSVRNVSLLNFVNGVASLTLETMDELQTSELEAVIKKVMKRSCSVVPHESNVILVQIGE